MNNRNGQSAKHHSPHATPWIYVLEGDPAKSVLQEYHRRTWEEYSGARVLNVLSYKKGTIVGSNPFAAVLINQITAEMGLHVATPADLQRAIQLREFPLQAARNDELLQYCDTAFILRRPTGVNAGLAERLLKQIPSKSIETPLVVPLADLELAPDPRSLYRLAFRIRTAAHPIYAQVLPQDGRFALADVDERSCLPKRLKPRGQRYFYQRDDGLTRFYVGGNQVIDIASDALANSDAGGRIVLTQIGPNAVNR